ncbi:hypothetical protein OROMI_017076 [Orobanche minor]
MSSFHKLTVGILAATVEDALIAYAAIAGDDSSHFSDATMPRVGFPLLKSANYMSADIKIARYGKGEATKGRGFGGSAPDSGVQGPAAPCKIAGNSVKRWFDDCSDDIRTCCSNAVAKLSDKYGWKRM